MGLFRRKRIAVHDIAPDEIFLDAHNLPQFDRDQFEGKIEKPISRRALFLFSLTLVGFVLIALGRVFHLQVIQGTAYAERARNNVLDQHIIFSQRGLILDRTGEKLAWNESRTGTSTGTTTEAVTDTYPFRRYDAHPALSHLLGYVRYPQKDKNGNYFQTEIDGVEGLERTYNSVLAGSQGHIIVERNALNEILSESTIDAPIDGQPIQLTIDARLQKALYDFAEELANDVGFAGGAGVIIDVTNGELLVAMSMPGYDPNIMTDGSDNDTISSYMTRNDVPFLNRAVGGLYTPGSIIKPFLALAALHEGIVTPSTEFYSDGALRVPNPYNPDQPTIFRDWKAHGWVDMRRAIAVSSNVYFMTIGGGFGGQKGLGIDNINKYVDLFHIGQKTGVDIPGEVEGIVPSIAWKKKVFPDDPWRLGDTYNSSIGQYGFQATPLQMARAAAMIANGGITVVPHVRADETVVPVERVDIPESMFEVVREGMYQSAHGGTAQALNVSYVEIAGKTGTAELGVSKEKVNSWIMGFWPYKQPKYAFAMVMEKGPVTNLIGSASILRRFFDWMHLHTPEYLQTDISA